MSDRMKQALFDRGSGGHFGLYRNTNINTRGNAREDL
jgi:hypothetical protein